MESKVHSHGIASDSSRILILDYGSQYTQLIARRVREAGVYSEIHSHDIPAKTITSFGAAGIILSGGPESVAAEDAPGVSDAVISAGVPLLGICYGMQALATKLGGEVRGSDHREFGYAEVSLIVDNPLLGDITSEDKKLKVWMSHGDRVEALPDGFKQIASSNNAPIAGMADVQNQIYGVQFHPEVTHTENGQLIIERFVHEICGCPGYWTPKNIISEHIERVRGKVGTEHVLLGLSGGVDSSVVAALLHAAIGDQLICVFVDNGLLRLNEGDQVMETFAEHLGVKVIRVNAEDKFLSALDGEEDPEKKRKIIGRNFIEVFEEQASILNDIQWLAQGTIYPDVIESSGIKGGKAHVIKSHHNVGGLPSYLNLPLVEPLNSLFKDEVRKIGLSLGLPKSLIGRHPFPGPGLAVRTIGEITKEKLDILREADHIFMEELKAAKLYNKVSQAFAVFLPIKSVGVVGDARRYEYVIALRAAETIDFMTAKASQLNHNLLNKVSDRIINEIPKVSRVVYDISSKPPATIEWE